MEKFLLIGYRSKTDYFGHTTKNLSIEKHESLEAVGLAVRNMEHPILYVIKNEIRLTEELKQALGNWQTIVVSEKNMQDSKKRLGKVSPEAKKLLKALGMSIPE